MIERCHVLDGVRREHVHAATLTMPGSRRSLFANTCIATVGGACCGQDAWAANVPYCEEHAGQGDPSCMVREIPRVGKILVAARPLPKGYRLACWGRCCRKAEAKDLSRCFELSHRPGWVIDPTDHPGIELRICRLVIRHVHPDRAAMIAEIQRTPGVTWVPGAVERFAAEAPGASKDLCGVKGNTTKSIESAIKRGDLERFFETDGDIPEEFDSAAQWPECEKIITDIRDQSHCGCCWAFAGAEAASDRMCIATKGKTMIPISAQDVCFNSNPDGCDGGQIDTPWQYIKDTGAVSGGQYKGTGPFGLGLCSDFSLPHCHHHGPRGQDPYPAEGSQGCPQAESPAGPTQCDTTAKAPHKDFKEDKYYYKGKTQTASGEKAIQQMIMSGGPVETAFDVYSDFELYSHGIYHHVKGEMVGGHAVRMVGWGIDGGVKYWKIANSWNPYWGEKGYFRMRRGTNEGGIENGVVGSSNDSEWGRGAGAAIVV
eukprot:s1889_g4.t1